jgi:hypothetical protein
MRWYEVWMQSYDQAIGMGGNPAHASRIATLTLGKLWRENPSLFRGGYDGRN